MYNELDSIRRDSAGERRLIMKKRVLPVMLCLCLITAILAGCGCKHEWKNATCEMPNTCALCGETNGEPLDHTWKPASCEAPKTCADCGKTEGEALEHTWVEATCEAPKTCSVCDTTEGEALEHTFGEWAEVDDKTEERTCSACNFAEQQEIDREAAMLRHLEGEWMVGDAVVGEDLISIEDLPAELEGTCFKFESDGTGRLTLMGENADGIVKFDGYEKDGSDDYYFDFEAGGDYVECLLCYEAEGESFLLLSLDEENALVFYKS